METIKLNIVTDKDWLEATWTKEVTTINEVEKDGELVQKESVATEQIHCESFSGHKEHIVMLEAKALELGTSLDEFEGLIKQCKDSFIYPTEDELAKEELQNKIQEANQYLADTDWIWNKKSREVDSQQSMTIDEFNIKYAEVIAKQKECIDIINKVEDVQWL